MNCHTLSFKGERGTRVISQIDSLHSDGRPKTDAELLRDASMVIHKFCSERKFKIYYTRIWNSHGKTIFDVGSHTEFFLLTPEVSLNE